MLSGGKKVVSQAEMFQTSGFYYNERWCLFSNCSPDQVKQTLHINQVFRDITAAINSVETE